MQSIWNSKTLEAEIIYNLYQQFLQGNLEDLVQDGNKPTSIVKLCRCIRGYWKMSLICVIFKQLLSNSVE